MYIKNTAQKDVSINSLEGYAFTIPTGVSWVWDEAGEHLLSVHKVESKSQKDIYGFDNGFGIPAITESKQEAWEEDGKKLATVTRYKINPALIPRVKLIDTARKRGVDRDEVIRYATDPNVDTAEIAEAINALPVPDEVRYPEVKEEVKEEVKSDEYISNNSHYIT